MPEQEQETWQPVKNNLSWHTEPCCINSHGLRDSWLAGGKRLKMEMWMKKGEEGAGRPRMGSVRGVRLKDLHVHDTGLNCSLPEEGEVVSFRHWLSKVYLLFPLWLWSLKTEGIICTGCLIIGQCSHSTVREKTFSQLNISHPQGQLRQCKCHGSELMTRSVLDKPSSEREGLVTLHSEIWHGLVKGVWRKKHPPSYLLSTECPQNLLLGIFTSVRATEGARDQIWEASGVKTGSSHQPRSSDSIPPWPEEQVKHNKHPDMQASLGPIFRDSLQGLLHIQMWN